MITSNQFGEPVYHHVLVKNNVKIFITPSKLESDKIFGQGHSDSVLIGFFDGSEDIMLMDRIYLDGNMYDIVSLSYYTTHYECHLLKII